MNAETADLLERPIRGVLTEAFKRWFAGLADRTTETRRLRAVRLLTGLSDADLARLGLMRRYAPGVGATS